MYHKEMTLVTFFAPYLLFTGRALAAGRWRGGRLRVELAAHGGVSLSNGRVCLGSLAERRRHDPWRVGD